MPDVLIITDALSANLDTVALSAVAQMKRVIWEYSSARASQSTEAEVKSIQVDIVTAADLDNHPSSLTSDRLICPLTLSLPKSLFLTGKEVFAACADVQAMRQMVAAWHDAVGDGTYWLPIVLTAKGALFAEAIATTDSDAIPYQQPFHLNDVRRQPLYRLGQRLIKTLLAPPGVYLLQFGMDDHQMWFDRLLPFPDQPAIASVGVQTPDLFLCHWLCLTHQPIRDLSIIA